jgi:hypothetical protein
VRADEKQVDGPDLERAEHKESLREQEEDELPQLAGEDVRDVDQAGTGRRQLIDAMRMILERHNLSVSSLRLPQREARALEALQAAVTGRSTSLDQFVFAEDRSSLLEQALAVLQPNLAGGNAELLAALHDQVEALTHRVTELRHELEGLEDAQDDLIEAKGRGKEATDTDTDTNDKPNPKPSDPDAPRPASTLAGPERSEPAKIPTTLVGPEVKEAPKPPSTLSGPEIEEAPKPETTLGDPDELSKLAKQPWWKRPLG